MALSKEGMPVVMTYFTEARTLSLERVNDVMAFTVMSPDSRGELLSNFDRTFDVVSLVPFTRTTIFPEGTSGASLGAGAASVDGGTKVAAGFVAAGGGDALEVGGGGSTVDIAVD